MLYTIVGLLAIILDQWVKYWVAGSISTKSLGEPFIPGIISLVNLHNDGAAFGMFSGGGARIYFIILTGVFTVAVILMLATGFIKGRVARWSIVLVTAGGLSNCIDRVIYGYVQDMFKVELFDFAVFNVADIFITVFCLIFAIAVMFEKDPEPEYDEDDLFEEDDEEADKPSLFGRKKDKYEEEEEEVKKPKTKLGLRKKAAEIEEEAPIVKKAAEPAEAQVSKKPAKRKYDEEYEQYKARRAAQQAAQGAAAPAAKPAPAIDPADPFAEWERANARVEAQQKNTSAVNAGMPAAPAARPQPVKPAAPVEEATPVRPAAPAAKPAAGDDFDIDSILAEFK